MRTKIYLIIIITLFESQIILAEHECCTNWGDCKSNKSNQIKSNVGFRIKDFILSCLINLVLKKRFKATSVMSSVLQSVGMQTAEVTK